MNAIASPFSFRDLSRYGLGTPILVIFMLGMLVIPLPPFLLDISFTFNIALSLVVLLMSIYALRPWTSACSPRCCWSRPCCV